MLNKRGMKITSLLIILIILLFLTSSLAMAAPHYLPGESSENAPQQQTFEELFVENTEGLNTEENTEEELNQFDEEDVQNDPLPLEAITVPPEPFMGSPTDISGAGSPELPQTGAGILFMETGFLIAAIGVIGISFNIR